MKHVYLWFYVLFSVGVTLPAMTQQKEIIGYYPSWKWKSGTTTMTPARIPYKKLTIIDYAFFYPQADGHLAGRDSIGDDLILNGERDTLNGTYKSGSALVELAHRNGVKVLLSVGGWDDSYNFPQVAASQATRAVFAHSCIEQLQKYGFDGIDVDWEFPCFSDHKGTPDDKYNYTFLLQLTRDSLDLFGSQTNRHYLLTAALPAQESRMKNYEIQKVTQLLDMLNVMTYDLSGQWDSLSGHNAPLYAPNAIDTDRNVDAAFRLFNKTYNLPASKINLGVPFYGRTYADCVGLYAHHKGVDTVHFPDGDCFYYDIVACRDKFSRMWDDRAKVPYLVSSSWKTFISYDDEESVRYKAQYVIDNHACGLIIWEITGDFLPDGSTPLLDVIDSTFRASVPK